jgi:probable HAF family extracellular repeat protein
MVEGDRSFLKALQAIAVVAALAFCVGFSTTFRVSAQGAKPPPATASPISCGAAYCVTDLGGPYPSFATALNDSGDIVGKVGRDSDGRAFLWGRAAMKMLGTLETPFDPPSSVAFAVNNLGAIVGSSGDNGVGPMDGLSFAEAFVYDTSLKPLIPHDANEMDEEQRAFGINNGGTIVGIDGYHGFIFKGGVLISVSPLSTLEEGNGSVAMAINDSGQVVGATTYNRRPSPFPQIHAFLWRNPPTGKILDIGSLPGYRDSIAMAINSSGEIVGYTSQGEVPNEDNPDISTYGKWVGERDPDTLDFSLLPKNGHAFSWKNGIMHDLGTLSSGSAALAVNDAGSIVGVSRNRAVGWFGNGIVDLNSLIPHNDGWVLQAATGINNHGWIVGWGQRHGQRRAFLLKRR